MPLTVRKFNAQVKDPTSGDMIPAGLLSSDSLEAIEAAETAAVAAVGAKQAVSEAAIELKGATTLASIPADYTTLDNEVDDLKTQISVVNAQFPEINGAIIPPPFEIGARWNNNGEERWTDNPANLTLKRGTYIELKTNDVVSINKTIISAYYGGYTTDGTTFTTISSRIDDFIVETTGLYFFTLLKVGGGNFTPEDAIDGWELIRFTRSGSMKDKLLELDSAETDIANIKTAIDFEIAPATPTDYYTLPNTGKDLNYRGEPVDNSGTDTSDYISMDGLYDICRVVQNTTKYGMCNIYYYDTNKTFVKRDLPGTNYTFSTFNGETVVWFNIDKTNQNLKYIRFVSENNKGFKYWVVENSPQASILENYAQKPFLNKKIVNFGDSIFGQTRPPKDISSYLAEKTGATVYNCGFGGCEMTTHAQSNYNPFSMCNLADAVASGVWTTQEEAASESGMPAYFAETVELLKSIDFTDIDIITIAYGTNDWMNSSPLDNGGTSDKSYFADALRYSLETILTAYPNLHVFICTPIYRFWVNEQGQFVEDSNTKINITTNTKLTDFVEKTIEVAEKYNVSCINNYAIGMNKLTRTYYYPTDPIDGTHPNPTGNKLIAAHIAKELF